MEARFEPIYEGCTLAKGHGELVASDAVMRRIGGLAHGRIIHYRPRRLERSAHVLDCKSHKVGFVD